MASILLGSQRGIKIPHSHQPIFLMTSMASRCAGSLSPASGRPIVVVLNNYTDGTTAKSYADKDPQDLQDTDE